MLQYVAVCCSVLQCVAVSETWRFHTERARVLQCVAVCCSVLQCVAVCCSELHSVRPGIFTWHERMCCSALQHVVACCSVLQRVAVCCSVSKYVRNDFFMRHERCVFCSELYVCMDACVRSSCHVCACVCVCV